MVSNYLLKMHGIITESSKIAVKKIYGNNQVTPVNITNIGTKCHHVSLAATHGEGNNISLILFLPKIHNLNLVMRKHQINSN